MSSPLTSSLNLVSRTQEFIVHYLPLGISIEELNRKLEKVTGITNFFTNEKDHKKFINFVKNYPKVIEKEVINPEFGEIQTPPSLVKKVYQILKKDVKFQPSILIEPTCGKGQFLLHAPEFYPKLSLMYGVELQKKFLWRFVFLAFLKYYRNKSKPRITTIIKNDNVFFHTFSLEELDEKPAYQQPILIIGNPPWITSSKLSMLESKNIPVKANIHNIPGINALTGSSNFDLAEVIIKQMMKRFSSWKGKIALLCKNSVIKRILKDLPNTNLSLKSIESYQFNARELFNVNCEASLLLIDLGDTKKPTYQCKVKTLNNPQKTSYIFGWTNGHFVANKKQYLSSSFLEGRSSFEWRQGVKHDANKVMELELVGNNRYKNKLDEEISLEAELIYPLLKGSDLQKVEVTNSNKRIILTQRKLNQKTAYIKDKYPKIWDYLQDKKRFFTKRKSKIYQKAPPFSLFGIGEYSFKPFKVGIAGMYPDLIFSFIPPIDKKPVMLDDTSYFIGFNNYQHGLIVNILLNTSVVRNFLSSLIFPLNKRPVTKRILMRINWQELMDRVSFERVRDEWKEKKYDPLKPPKRSYYEELKHLIK
jgi:hypothetical protein